MNSVILIGNLVADPEYRQTANGIANASFRIAVQRRFKAQDGKRESDFITVVAWRQTAELVGKFLRKGNKCCVRGSIQTRTYEGRDGQKKTAVEVVADEVEFLTPRSEQAEAPAAPQQTFTEVIDDELPFDL